MSKELLAEIIKQRRKALDLSLAELGAISGVSGSHLGRVERGERFPSPDILNKIAKPLGFEEIELLTLAEYLTPTEIKEEPGVIFSTLDPYVAKVLSQESVQMQRTLLGILQILKSISKENT